ncbi:MAG: hypothetical protein ACREVK_06285, partial [Gammaproteobacteria bacterium]
MQKGLGIAALVLAIMSISIPVVGPWITVLSALMAAFAYGSALPLGIASIVINVVNILFLSPSIWIQGALVSAGAEMHGDKIVFFPWIVLGAQAIASAVLIVFHIKSKSTPTGEANTLRRQEPVLPMPREVTASQTLGEAEVPKRQITEDISTGIDTPLPPESKNETTPPIQQFTSSTVASEISSEAAVAGKEASPQAAL